MAFCLALLVGCSKGVVRVRVLRLPAPNPTSRSFDLPIWDAHARIMAALRERGAFPTIFGAPPHDAGGPEYADYFAVEDASAPAFAADIFKDSNNRDDIYAHTFGSPIWPSPVYRGGYGGLPFVAAFQVHLAAAGVEKTIVTVIARDTEIINGMVWGIAPCGPGYAYHREDVKPTTVEEYTLLRFLSRRLGAKEMPPARIPVLR